jgi:hypothetical protein
MGFSTILDVLGSMIIGGLLLVIVLRLNEASVQKIYSGSNDLTIQQNLTTIVQMVEYDFRKIGYFVNPDSVFDPRTGTLGINPSDVITYADSMSIHYYADVFIPGVDPYALGDIDSVKYYLGSLAECDNTPNPRDRILYRVVNNETPMPSNLGVTQFQLIYFDILGDTIPSPVEYPDNIQKIEVNLTIEDVAAYDQQYSKAFWKQLRLASRNMTRSQLKKEL